ncbi:hypothetical protein EMEDMD4_1060061 [Sinorhizobium medicae]|uniref:Uncharacterized protein n=1 Tax=Sinorhizobium medicae TaxID=110321 RepID=A0A508WUN9_9HYPH|nr:hypothetical protein EMEDMD4_1060061 [Sinorhizobium medicae]
MQAHTIIAPWGSVPTYTNVLGARWKRQFTQRRRLATNSGAGFSASGSRLLDQLGDFTGARNFHDVRDARHRNGATAQRELVQACCQGSSQKDRRRIRRAPERTTSRKRTP